MRKQSLALLDAVQPRVYEVFILIETCLQVIVVGINVRGCGLLYRLLLRGRYFDPKPFHYLGCDLIFKAQNVCALQIVSLRPFRVSSAAVDQLNGDPDRSRSALICPSSTLSTPNVLATSTGSGVSFAYFRTDVVGRTARFCKEVRRLMIASVIPIAQLSLVAAEMSWNGKHRDGFEAAVWRKARCGFRRE